MKRALGLSLGLVVFASGIGRAQATGTPSFNAPNRAFDRTEVGAFVSLPGPGTGWEGSYRGARRLFDVGIRGGVFDPGGLTRSSILAGFDARAPMIRHGRNFPLDVAFIFGAGARLRQGASRFTVPIAFSLGRRIGPENGPFSITAYAQPTWFANGGNGMETSVLVGLGLGLDARVRQALDLRLGFGAGDLQGFSLGVVWLH